MMNADTRECTFARTRDPCWEKEKEKKRNECDQRVREERERRVQLSGKEEEKKTRDSGEFVAYVDRAASRGSSHAPQSCLDTGQHRVALRWSRRQRRRRRWRCCSAGGWNARWTVVRRGRRSSARPRTQVRGAAKSHDSTPAPLSKPRERKKESTRRSEIVEQRARDSRSQSAKSIAASFASGCYS